MSSDAVATLLAKLKSNGKRLQLRRLTNAHLGILDIDVKTDTVVRLQHEFESGAQVRLAFFPHAWKALIYPYCIDSGH